MSTLGQDRLLYILKIVKLIFEVYFVEYKINTFILHLSRLHVDVLF